MAYLKKRKKQSDRIVFEKPFVKKNTLGKTKIILRQLFAAGQLASPTILSRDLPEWDDEKLNSCNFYFKATEEVKERRFVILCS